MDIGVNESSYSFDTSDSILGYLNNLQAYNLYEGVDRLLDISREVAIEGTYYPMIIPFPLSGQITIGALQEFSGVIQVPIGSILVGISGVSITIVPNVSQTTNNQFGLKIYDKANGLDLYNGNWGFGMTVAPPIEPNLVNATVSESGMGPMGMLYVPEPFIVTEPNSLQVSILNTLSSEQVIQVALHFAVPFNAKGSGVDALIEGR